MTTRLLFVIALLQGDWRPGDAWCFYFCPKEKWPETFCAVDQTRGAKLFQGRCQIWKANYCQTAEYKVMDMKQCLDRYPGVLVDFLASRNSITRFDKFKTPPAVGPWRRFFLLWSLVSRLSPRVYPMSLPLTIIPWLLNPQSPFAKSFYYPGSPLTNPSYYPGSPQSNPLYYPGSPLL